MASNSRGQESDSYQPSKTFLAVNYQVRNLMDAYLEVKGLIVATIYTASLVLTAQSYTSSAYCTSEFSNTYNDYVALLSIVLRNYIYIN